MTPKEQYKKFYDKPHLWIDAIEVGKIGTNNWEKLDCKLYSAITELDYFCYYAPKFKPQEGEQFLKDLETAVSAATGIEFVYKDIDKGKHRLYSKDFGYVVKLPIININLVRAYQTETGMAISYFDTAAYVDKMRELGYYFVK